VIVAAGDVLDAARIAKGQPADAGLQVYARKTVWWLGPACYFAVMLEIARVNEVVKKPLLLS
jgi:hypothetical protein